MSPFEYDIMKEIGWDTVREDVERKHPVIIVGQVDSVTFTSMCHYLDNEEYKMQSSSSHRETIGTVNRNTYTKYVGIFIKQEADND